MGMGGDLYAAIYGTGVGHLRTEFREFFTPKIHSRPKWGGKSLERLPGGVVAPNPARCQN